MPLGIVVFQDGVDGVVPLSNAVEDLAALDSVQVGP
jgi:hypothetical protein